MEYISPFDIFYEEDSLPFYKKRKVIYRKWLPIDEVENIYKDYVKLKDNERQKILTMPYKFSSKNYTKYKLLTYYDEIETQNDPQYE
jgi:hypothetical protein